MSVTTQIRALNISKKENGVVYTPTPLAEYLAQKVVELFLSDLSGSAKTTKIRNLKIIDPACGEGELLTAAWRSLIKQTHESVHTSLDAKSILCGVDLDDQSIKKTREKIDELQQGSTKSSYNLISTNALVPNDRKQNISSWVSLKKRYVAEQGFDILIANPPWGANMASYEDKLTGANFTLNKGQYDSSDLFVELAMSLVKQNGYFAFIIPDSLFAFERKNLRKLLLENSEIKFIGRLGEKIFEGVNRACVVLICKNTRPSKDNLVNCLRLNIESRKSILNGNSSYFDAEKKLAHTIKQSRFSSDSELLFDIDTKEAEIQVLNKISSAGELIGSYVTSARGVELSKTGKIYKCSTCEQWAPLPNTDSSKCMHCGVLINLKNAQTATIISKKKFKGSKPILVGESVRRYSISSRLWISTDNKGINYKSISLYYEPKILVRKTGVGITATIDYSNSLTNQVVYMFKPRTDAKYPVPIEFILAVMNSRAIYYYLLKKYGETEWRSHPYLTQSQVLNLPLPDTFSKEAKSAQKKIVSLLKPYLEKQLSIPKNIDAQTEFLVASMFGLSKNDYELIYKTITSTQGLIPVRELSVVGVNEIFE